VAFFQHDEAEMTRQVEAARRFPDGFRILANEQAVASFEGRLARAAALTAEFQSESASKTGLKSTAAALWANLAQAAAAAGDAAATRADVAKSLALQRSLGTLINSAFALASLGDAAGAQPLLDEARRLPLADSDEGRAAFATADAVIRMDRGDRTALDVFPAPKNDEDIGRHFTLGVINLQLGHAAAAADHLKKVIDYRRPVLSAIAPRAHLEYGRALAKLGKIDESRKAYEQFLESWKHADPDLPLLAAAKKEYAALPR
jgi:tetratricopeptide (TPR) repeat protein